MKDHLNKKVIKATKWAATGEVVSKLITPVTSMILARLLTPEVFGIVTTIAMITSFAGLFTDAGFHKYIVQHEFKDLADKIYSSNVAFWSNLFLSICIWGIIIISSDSLASLVGAPGLGMVLIVASSSIPLSAFSSIQSALLKRDFDFKTLFKVRLVSILVPLLVTVPLAVWLRDYWAIILGGIIRSIISAILLFHYSDWKPHFYYSKQKLKSMLSFSVWSQVESISIWLTRYVDVFIVGVILSQYYLGLYKTSLIVVGEITSLVTSATTPVLFASLSRLQNDEKEFRRLFFQFQKLVGLLVIPMCVGIFCYGDLVTLILLGNQWMEAVDFISLWGLTSAFTIVLSHYSSEIYRAKGRPRLSVLAQWLHIAALWPVVLISAKYGFQTLYIARSIVRLEIVVVNLVIVWLLVHFNPWTMIKNVLPAFFASAPMIVVAFCLRQISDDFYFQLLSVVLCAMTYFSFICQFPVERNLIDTYVLKKIRYW